MERSIRVLHVDDEPGFADMAATFLERETGRIDVESVTSASEALERLAGESFDCIVSDYDMPERNGIEFLEAVRETYPDLPFILYTGKGSEEIASEAISAGVTDYLGKGAGTSQYTVLANRIENAVAQYRAESSLAETRHRYQRLIEESSDVFTVLDREGYFDYVSPSVERVLGYRSEELLGDPAIHYVHPADREAILAEFEALLSYPDSQLAAELRFENTDGEWRWVEIRGRNLLDDRAIGGIVIYTRDITERKRQERVVKQLHDATRSLLRAETEQEAAEKVGEAAKTVLGYSNNIIRLLSEDGTRLEPVALVSKDLPSDLSARPTYEVGEETAGLAFERGEPIIYDDVTELSDDKRRDGARAGAYLPIGEHGVLTITEFEPAVFDETDIQLASILTANAATAFDRIIHQREQQARLEMLTEINERTTRLFRADSPEEICTIAAEAARDILGYPNIVVRLLDEDRGMLVPVAVTEQARQRYGDRPDYPIGKGVSGRAYERDEVLTYEDVRSIDDDYFPRGAKGSISLPIGEYGTITIAEEGSNEFDKSDIELARLLVAATEAALYRVRQQETVERQNERLDQFTSVVSHDLRNPLSVATGRLKLAREECDSEHLPHVEDALERMETLIEDLLTLARGDRTVNPEPVSLSAVAESSWANVGTPNGTLVTDVDRGIEADESRLKQLLENLIHNSFEHGRPDGNGPMTVTVGLLEDGFYVADDGAGLPGSDRDRLFEVGFSTRPGGGGFGLGIVEKIVDAHGWTIEATDGVDGGARFEIRGVEFVDV